MKKLVILVAVCFLFGFSKHHSHHKHHKHHKYHRHHSQHVSVKNTENICRIFQQNPSWYRKAKHTENKWGVPVAVQMAIINQESHFNSEAKAKSSAYGFSQALSGTWRSYKRSTGARGRRNEFAAATDFIGWYVHMTKRNLGISPKNTYALYLAYHEGLGGYKHKSYKHKPLIMRVAKNVRKKASTYQSQLASCRNIIAHVG